MKTKYDLITDEQIDAAWGYANFGPAATRREIIDDTVLKCASGYYTGHTAECITRELGLISPKKWQLTKLGKEYLYEAFVRKRI